MAMLQQYSARQAFKRIAPGLTRSVSKHVDELIELLGDDGSVSVETLHKELFPLSTAASANTQLSRLITTVNDATAAAGSSLRLAITSNKKLGKRRRIWFEGESPAPRSLTSELNATGNREIDDTRGAILDPCFVIMTFNEVERGQLLRQFEDLGEFSSATFDNVEYNRLGVMNGVKLIHRHCHQQGQVAAYEAASEAIRHWNPTVVFAVGIAMDLLDVNETPIGDVLVSEAACDTEMVRLNHDGTRSLRGREMQVFSKLLDRFKATDQARNKDPRWPRVRFGRILCGNPLVDHDPSRQELMAFPLPAIGYEMECIGVARAAEREGTYWIMAKGVSDRGDGSKGKNKSRNQALAAGNAMMVLRAVLEREVFPNGNPARGRGSQQPRRANHLSAYQARISQMNGLLVADPAGRPASFDKLGAATEDGGVPVMEYLQEWVDDPKAPPLFALLGEYGMGKTVTCERLYTLLSEKRAKDPTSPVPLYFDLRHVTGLDHRLPTIDQVLADCSSRGWYRNGDEPAFTAQHLLQHMERGAVIIFDGLDEVLVKIRARDGEIFTGMLLKTLDDFRELGRSAAAPKILISCRTQYFRNLNHQRNHFTGQERGNHRAQDFRSMVLLPFSDEQVERYLEVAVPDLPMDRLRDLIGQVHNLTELTQRPFTLRLVSELIPEIESEIVAGRPVYGVTLYRKMAQRWLDRDDGKHHIRPRDKMRLAAHLAAFLWRSGTGMLEAEQIEDWFHEWLNDQPALKARYGGLHPEQLDEDLRTATFLSRQDGDMSGFRFAHTSLQEFFLADYLLNAVRTDCPDQWAIRIPSRETLDFFGQLIEEAHDKTALLSALGSWRTAYRLGTSELLLAYALHARRRKLPVPTLRGIDLRGADLSDMTFGAADEPALDLHSANFRDAKLRRSRFYNVQLNSAVFNSAKLEQASFEFCHLSAASFEKADLTAATFRQCPMTDVKVSDALGYRTSFLFCDGITGKTPLAGLRDPLVGPAKSINKKKSDAILHWEVQSRMTALPACAFSPDGTRLLSGGDDGSLRLWDAASGEQIRAMTGHGDWVLASAFSPDGARLLSGGDDGSLRLWDAASGEQIRAMTGHEDWVRACAFSPDGARLLSGGDDGSLRLWDAANGEQIRAMTGHEKNVVLACSFSPDSALLLSGGSDGSLRLWDAASGEQIRAMTGHEDGVRACAFSPDGAHFLSGGFDGSLRLWDAASGEQIRAMTGPQNAVLACAFSPDGARLLSGGSDGSLRLWDVASGEQIRAMTGQGGWVLACAFSPDGARLLSGGDDGSLRLWDAASGEQIRAMTGYENGVWACAFGPDGARLLSGGSDGSLRLWDAAGGEQIRAMTGHGDWVRACAFSPDGARLLSGGDDGSLRLWDAASGKQIRAMTGHGDWVWACAFSPDGARLLSGGDDGSLRLWDAASGEQIRAMTGHGDWVRTCAFSPDGARLLSGGDDGSLLLWDAASGKQIRAMTGHEEGVRACAFSPDGARLLSGGDDGSLRLWDAASGEQICAMTGHENGVWACAFSPDGARLLSGGSDGSLRLWDAASGEQVRAMTGQGGWVLACAFSPDGTRLLSGGSDGSLRLWDAASGEQIRIHGVVRGGGYAVWETPTDRLIAARGEVWRCLFWRVKGINGIEGKFPLEYFGAVPGLDQP